MNDSSINRVVKDRGNCIHKNCKNMGMKYKGWIIMFIRPQLFRLFDSLKMKFRQRLALCCRYLVSDQDFKNGCDEVAFLN